MTTDQPTQPLGLAAIRARVDAATPGPWKSTDHYPHVVFQGGEENIVATNLAGDPLADGAFVAHARTDIPTLLAAVEAVLRLHVAGSYGDCCECGVPWPCPTVRDIRSALAEGGEVDHITTH